MRIVIAYDIEASEGGNPDPEMARRVVEEIRSALTFNTVIEEAIRRVEKETQSSIPLGRRSISIERSFPTIYGVKE